MSTVRPLKTVLIGFGRIAQGYAKDPVFARALRYATHAQVLKDHPAYAWTAVVDLSSEARNAARSEWGVETIVESVDQLPTSTEAEVAVITTPADARAGLLDHLPSLRAVIVEKPLGLDRNAAEAFVAACEARGIALQVNYLRRADALMRTLANGRLHELMGSLQYASCVYGNGLLNNGSHMIDLSRMLFGEVRSLRNPTPGPPLANPPVPGDANFSFELIFETGVVNFHPIDFRHYRENGIEAWGTMGRMNILQEGLGATCYPLAPNRGLADAHEVASDCPEILEPTLGDALHDLYTNVAEFLLDREDLWSPGRSALITESIVDRIRTAAAQVPRSISQDL